MYDALGVSHIVIYKNDLPVAGIKESNSSMNSINFYPNPTNDQFTLAINALDQKYDLLIENMLGQTIYKEKISGNNFMKSYSSRNVVKGVYTIKIVGKRKSIAQN